MSKTVLCYGDSNTYGYNPSNGMRYPENVRWTGRLQKLLGTDYKVIEEGCNGRTTVFENPIEPWKNGLTYLRPCLNSHKPIDIIILMLGSNDLKECYHASAEEIAKGADRLVEVICEFTEQKQGFIPRIILVSPVEVGVGIKSSPFYGGFTEDAIARSKDLSNYYRRVAKKRDCVFLDAAKICAPSDEDSIHLTAEGHKALADALFERCTK